MNKKLQEMWDSAHEIPKGAYVPEGTVLVHLEPTGPFEEAVLTHYVTGVSDYWQGSPVAVPVRSVDPLPDTDDTGVLSLHTEGERIAVVVGYDARCYTLTKNQARNLARKITEAL